MEFFFFGVCKSFLDRLEKHAMYGFEKPFCQREVVGKKIKKEIIITTTLLHFFGLQATHTFLTLLVRKITCSISQNNQQFTAYIQSVSSKSIRITYQPNIHRQKKNGRSWVLKTLWYEKHFVKIVQFLAKKFES